MRARFLREDAVQSRAATLVARSSLLRELILAACEQSVMWDEAGTGRHFVSLALLEISRAAPRPIAIPPCRYPWRQRLTEALVADPADPQEPWGVYGYSRPICAHGGAAVAMPNTHELRARRRQLWPSGSTCRPRSAKEELVKSLL